MPLAARLVQPLTLVLHELTSNAVQHGALREPTGSVSIEWSVDNARATLHWREQGAGPISPPVRTGFGMGMIEGVIQRQLRGEASFSWEAPGVNACLSFDTGVACNLDNEDGH